MPIRTPGGGAVAGLEQFLARKREEEQLASQIARSDALNRQGDESLSLQRRNTERGERSFALEQDVIQKELERQARLDAQQAEDRTRQQGFQDRITEVTSQGVPGLPPVPVGGVESQPPAQGLSRGVETFRKLSGDNPQDRTMLGGLLAAQAPTGASVTSILGPTPEAVDPIERRRQELENKLLEAQIRGVDIDNDLLQNPPQESGQVDPPEPPQLPGVNEATARFVAERDPGLAFREEDVTRNIPFFPDSIVPDMLLKPLPGPSNFSGVDRPLATMDDAIREGRAGNMQAVRFAVEERLKERQQALQQQHPDLIVRPISEEIVRAILSDNFKIQELVPELFVQ